MGYSYGLKLWVTVIGYSYGLQFQCLHKDSVAFRVYTEVINLESTVW